MRRHARSSMLLLSVLALALASCGDDAAGPSTTGATTTTAAPTTTVSEPAPLIATDELAGIVDHLEAVVEGHAAAWTAQDVEAILSYYDDDTVHDDSLFGVVLQGEDLYEMPEGFVAEYDGYRTRVVEVFVARSVAMVVDEGWGMTLRRTTFTEESPMLEVDRVEVHDDGTIGRWSLYYDLDLWEGWNSPSFRMEPARAVLDAWVAAWDTGDAAAFGLLYDADGERVDTLLGTSATGPDAIASVATDLAADASVTKTLEFSDSRAAAADVDVVGAVIEMAFPDGCVVRSIVVLTVSDGTIDREEVFWDADSLLACGWAA